MKLKLTVLLSLCFFALHAQDLKNNPTSNHGNKFEQLGTLLPTPNVYRTASGAPGHSYWQQRADYNIQCTLDEPNLLLKGTETITYFNNSPDVLTYLWLQVDENEHNPAVNSQTFNESRMSREMTISSVNDLDKRNLLADHGCKIEFVKDATGRVLNYKINQTMMRVDLPNPLKPGQTYKLNIAWQYKIPNRKTLGGRGGYELFPEDGNSLFTIAQWFPRLCVYSDFQGWQNHQFTGRGEFALVFGNYDVAITAPADHVIGATGECVNYAEVLSPARLNRWKKAQTASEPVEIALLAEATQAEKTKAKGTKTWHYSAKMVRDFAFGSSRKFIWDAMPITVAGKKVMCMSYYPKEAYTLYKRYSTKVVAHTIKSYSKFTTDYPYPVAISVEADNGMEYPMICFNNGRTEKDGTYSESTKYSMIGVIIHEVGHNFFPMIVNSDERQWSWMDEGLNTFTQYLTGELWDNKYPLGRGPAHKIVDYMRMPKNQLEPIMTNSENIVHFGPNAYSKPATALNVLRETIMGRELFDYAFKEYSRRWAYKHPTPADFFRTMEDASAVDLDWFWRGWFYGIEPCDISIDSVKILRLADKTEPKQKTDTFKIAGPQYTDSDDNLTKQRNREEKIKFVVDEDKELQDFYYQYTRGLAKVDDKSPVIRTTETLPEDESFMQELRNKWFYEIRFKNIGGLVMPIIVEFTFKDGSKKTERIAAEIWRKNENEVTKVFILDQEVVTIKQDPYLETADINTKNNVWPTSGLAPSNFQLFKGGGRTRNSRSSVNPAQREIKAP